LNPLSGGERVGPIDALAEAGKGVWNIGRT
jgi:hypothetical protein